MKRDPYSGKKRKLLLAFDIGTTYSGISYSILDPGKEPEIQGVHRFPGQVKAGGDSKIPSILYYDKIGRVRAVGAEAERDGIEIMAEEEGWVKSEWFKMHYRPKNFPIPNNITIPQLPPFKSILDVLSDFLKYLNDCAKQYIQDVHPGIGKSLWDSSSEGIHYILSHPNRWEGYSQGLMKQAAEKAGLIIPGGKNNVISFISEGEASLNRCFEKGLMNDSIRSGKGVIIVDAGGGTLDFSAYALDLKSGGKNFEEIVEPQCHFKGAELVTEAAGVYLNKLLKGSKYHTDVPDIKRIFNKRTKHTFRDSNDPCFIHFGSVRDKDRRLRIIAGKLRLDGEDVASFFEPSIKCIIDTVRDMQRTSRKPIHTVFLVGGFSDNGYLFKRVKDELSTYGLVVSRPDARVNKVVADGAIKNVLDNPVRSRITRHAFGVECNIIYDSTYPDHVKRKSKCIVLHSGERAIPNGFNLLIPRNAQLSQTQEFRCSYTRTASTPGELIGIEKHIYSYRGNLPSEKYKWMDNDPSGFEKFCTVKANSRNIPITTDLFRRGGRACYNISIDIILLLGGTEPKAQIAWKDRGKEKRREADIIYDMGNEIEGMPRWERDLENTKPVHQVPDKLPPSPTQDAKIKYDMDDQEDESQWTQVGKKKKKKQPSQQTSKPEPPSPTSPKVRYYSPPSPTTKKSPGARTWSSVANLDWAAEEYPTLDGRRDNPGGSLDWAAELASLVDWATDSPAGSVDWAAEDEIFSRLWDTDSAQDTSEWVPEFSPQSEYGSSDGWEVQERRAPNYPLTWGVPIWKGGRKQSGKRV